MNAKDIIKSLMDEKGKTNSDLANALGISQAAAWDRLNSPKTNNLTVNKLVDMLRYLDCELVVMPHGKSGRIENAYVIDNGETK